jgi:hypothetical protein
MYPPPETFGERRDDVDGAFGTVQDPLVACRLLLALAFVLSVGTATAHAAQMTPGAATPTSGDDGDRWNVAPHTTASITESVWKSSNVHAELAGIPCPDRVATRTPDRLNHPGPRSSLRSLDLPLLL